MLNNTYNTSCCSDNSLFLGKPLITVKQSTKAHAPRIIYYKSIVHTVQQQLNYLKYYE